MPRTDVLTQPTPSHHEAGDDPFETWYNTHGDDESLRGWYKANIEIPEWRSDLQEQAIHNVLEQGLAELAEMEAAEVGEAPEEVHLEEIIETEPDSSEIAIETLRNLGVSKFIEQLPEMENLNADVAIRLIQAISAKRQRLYASPDHDEEIDEDGNEGDDESRAEYERFQNTFLETEVILENINSFGELNTPVLQELITQAYSDRDHGNEFLSYYVPQLLNNIDKFKDLDKAAVLETLYIEANVPHLTSEETAFPIIDRLNPTLDERRQFIHSVIGHLTSGEPITFRSSGVRELQGHRYQLWPLSTEDLNTLRTDPDFDDQYFEPYPGESRNNELKDRWFAQEMFKLPHGVGEELEYSLVGFNQQMLGRLVRTRIETGVAHNIHEAAYWLTPFTIPREAHDIARILRDRNGDNFDPSLYETEPLKDFIVEERFFGVLATLPWELRKRLNFSNKEGVAEQLFTETELQNVYRTLTEGDNPLYKQENFPNDLIPKYVITDVDPKAQISLVVAELKTMALRRKQYIDDVQGWLMKHATSPQGRLMRAWGDRAQALLAGVPDSARSIGSWQNENALRDTVEQYEGNGILESQYGLTAEEVLGDDAKATRAELSRVLSAHDTLNAMSKLRRWREGREWERKLLPEASIEVSLEDVPVSQTKPYRFDILGADDPRGFTIGEDTGCCMTIEGVSRSCIKAGYKYENAGFVAMYAPNGDIAAQSFWYVHPEYEYVLVLDNIEANEGRDHQKVIAVYQQALRQYLEAHPELGIREVTVGTGYTEVGITELPVVPSVPALNDEIYTDAESQRQLLDLSK